MQLNAEPRQFFGRCNGPLAGLLLMGRLNAVYTEQYILHCTQYSYLNYELQMYRCKAVFWRIGSTVCTVYVGQNTHYVLPRGGGITIVQYVHLVVVNNHRPGS